MQTLTPELSEVTRCWDLLPHPSGTVARVFARDRETGAMDGDFARSAGEMFTFARANAHRQCYVCPNPVRPGTAGIRHSAADVTHWSYVLVDMDPVEETYDAAAALEEALLWLGEWTGKDLGPGGQRPTIIDSGRGAQAWVRLDDVPMLDEGMMFAGDVRTERSEIIPGVCTLVGNTRSVVRRVSGYWLGKLAERVGLCHGCRVDTSTSDLPRPMRMPGTFNQKTGRMARVVEAGDGPIGGLAHILISITPKDKLVDPPPPVVRRGVPWQLLAHQLTLTARNYLTQGQEEPGRHKAMWHAAKKLSELGLTRESARAALMKADRLRGEANALGAEAVDHALDTAFNGGD